MLKRFLPALALAACGLLTAAAVQAQTAPEGPRPCDYDRQQAQYFAAHPGEETRYRAMLHDVADNLLTAQQRGTLAALPDVTVPVVIHVLYLTTPGSNVPPANITTDRQIRAALDSVNLDYSKQNYDTALIIPRFRPIVGNIGFKFRLAKLDPNGNCTTGITRHYTTEASYGTAGASNVVYWNPDRYLNVWIVDDIASGAGGYTFGNLCPGGASTDGIVIRRSQFGVNNICRNNLCERSLTHEIGHFFGLPHTWGRTNTPGASTNCTMNGGRGDGIADTPLTAGYDQAAQGPCNTAYAPCRDASNQPIISNVQNYMDYSDCLRMFTLGQRAVMRGLLTDPRYSCRATLVSAANLALTGTNDGYVTVACAPIVAFSPTQTTVCENTPVSFRDYSYNLAAGGGTLTYTWDFPGGTPATATSPIATTSYATAGFYNVTLTVTNSAGPGTYTATNLIKVSGPAAGLTGPLTESFETPSFFAAFPPPSLLGYSTSGNTPTGTTNKPGYPSLSVRWQQQGGSIPAADGSNYLIVRNSTYVPMAVSVLTTPNIDLGGVQGTPFVEFSRYLAPRLDALGNPIIGTENLVVAGSTDCGVTYNTIANLTALQLYSSGTQPSTVPTSAADWQPLRLSVPQYQGARRLQLRFTMTNGTTAGNNFYFDALRVSSPLATRASLADRGIALYPNPLTNETALHLTLPATTQIGVRLTDVLGREVLALPAKAYAAGPQTIALSTTARALPAGLYVVRVALDGQVYSSKLTVQ